MTYANPSNPRDVLHTELGSRDKCHQSDQCIFPGSFEVDTRAGKLKCICAFPLRQHYYSEATIYNASFPGRESKEPKNHQGGLTHDNIYLSNILQSRILLIGFALRAFTETA